MASIFQKSTTTIFLIFLALSSINNAYVLDIDGSPLISGEKYYIIPQSKGVGGGLTLAQLSETLPCPLFVTRDKDETSLGIPVTFYTPTIYTPSSMILINLPIYIVFQDIPNNNCMEPLLWNMVPGDPNNIERLYVGTGNNGFMATFMIEYGGPKEYKIKFLPFVEGAKGMDVGIFEKDGFLGLTNEVPLLVQFKKVASQVLAVKV